MREGTIEQALSRVSLRMARTLDLGAVLAEITNGLANDLGAALARIWLVEPGDLCGECFLAAKCPDRRSCLHLVASAGLSERLDGSHRRIPRGVLKVGRIASAREAVCSNSLLDEPRIVDKTWVRQEGLVAFAGYPLEFGSEVFGVLAMFARRPLTQVEFERIGVFAAQASVAIENARLFETASRLSRQLEAENAHLKEELRVLLLDSEVVIFEQGSDLRYRWICNPQLFKAEDVIGKRDADLFPPDIAARMTAAKQHVLDSGKPAREELRVSRNGVSTLYQIDLHPRRDASGAVVGVTGVSADITEQRRIQEALTSALASREQMIGVLGHDLRNPATAVHLLATLLLRRQELPETMRESLVEIGRAGTRMLELIATLLDFTASRASGLPVVAVTTDVHEVARNAVEEVRAANPGRAIELEVEGDGRGTCDPARITQVLTNLVGNALDHGAEDAPVRVLLRGEAADVTLCVSNEGPPIPTELVHVLFEPFRRGPARGARSSPRGVGLGLFIAREIVNAHGGVISVESTADHGTTFTVRLPRAASRLAGNVRRLDRDEGAPASS